mmetsp:Transcript_13704/g.38946  ORF Transcript_13704/g.38946 Transcript_13704/m.38946 type:complete len:334 (-) Transcript_13704:176-1177(-)
MGPGALGVHGRGRHGPPPLGPLEELQELLRAGAVLLGEVLDVHQALFADVNIKLLTGVAGQAPPGHLLHHQVHELVPVELHHRHPHGAVEPRVVPLDGPEDLADRPRRDALGAGRIGAVHGEGLAGPRLAVGEHGDVVAVGCRLHEVTAILEDLLLGAGREDGVEVEGAALLDLQRHAAHRLPDVRVALLRLLPGQGPDAAEDADVALQLLDDVVELPSLGLCVGNLLLQGLDARLLQDHRVVSHTQFSLRHFILPGKLIHCEPELGDCLHLLVVACAMVLLVATELHFQVMAFSRDGIHVFGFRRNQCPCTCELRLDSSVGCSCTLDVVPPL